MTVPDSGYAVDTVGSDAEGKLTDMRRKSMARLAAATAGLTLYGVVFRPRMARWGATDEEVYKELPGDEIDNPMGDRAVSTRAITIDAPPEEVWPWLIQMGSGRAGFYTHEWIERLLFIKYADGHSSTRIHPEWQELEVGECVPYSRFNSVPVMLVDPPNALWAGERLVLEPLDGGERTRLIARTRGGWVEPFARRVPGLWPLLWPMAALIDRGPGELLHHYMEVGMLKGIKARAERASKTSSSPGDATTVQDEHTGRCRSIGTAPQSHLYEEGPCVKGSRGPMVAGPRRGERCSSLYRLIRGSPVRTRSGGSLVPAAQFIVGSSRDQL
jgi:hypothetical protein